MEEEEEEVGGHCDCLALTFASHILPGCQWHSTGEFSVAISDFCSRTETRYYSVGLKEIWMLYGHAKTFVRSYT